MPEARVISKLELPAFDPGGKMRIRTQLTYVVGIQPPRTIYIDKQDPTTDEIIAAIRADQAQPMGQDSGILQI